MRKIASGSWQLVMRLIAFFNVILNLFQNPPERRMSNKIAGSLKGLKGSLEFLTRILSSLLKLYIFR